MVWDQCSPDWQFWALTFHVWALQFVHTNLYLAHIEENETGVVLDSMLFDQSNNDIGDEKETSDPLFPGRVELADLQYLTAGNNIPIIEVDKTKDIIGPKRQERDLFIQRFYQTSFL